MSAAVADLFVVLDSVTDPFSRGMKKAAADAEAESRRMSGALGAITKVGLGLGAAVVGIGVTSVGMAAKFQSSMETLHTQAGVAQNQIAGLSNGVLSLAGQVGFAPDSLAQALYHIESSFASVGITGPKALDLLKVAAEGAAVGHADLVDVTNALDAAVVSGIPGVENLNQAMGILNATVGAGDMTMQDLANAFGTGVLASVKGFGITITDVGAALATFGDNNIRGSLAGNEFRMAVQALAKPVATAGDALKKLGLTQTTLADDMQKGGLKLALTDLVDRMNKAGIKADQQGQIITDAFGRKAGTGIDILIGQFDRTMSKYPDLTKGATGFGEAWQATKATISQQFNEIRSGADALAVRLGQALLPQVSKLISEGQGALGQFEQGFKGGTIDIKAPNFHNASLNQQAISLTQPQSAVERFGQTVHRVLDDVVSSGRRLEPVGQNFVTFGLDLWQAGEKIFNALEPTARLLGGALLLGIEGAGKAAANILGPAIKWFADFLDQHRGAIETFSTVVLGGMILKMAILGGINAAEGIVKLATAVVSFPLGQFGQIGDAVQGLKNAWTGKAATETEDAVQGLSGALSDLKQAGSNVLDKVLPDSGKLATLASMGQDITGIEQAAGGGLEQLSLFETNMQGIVQAADHEQLSLFDTEMVNIGNDAPGVASGMEHAATSAEGLGTKLGKFALGAGMVGAVVGGLTLIGTTLGHMSGIGFQTTMTVQGLTDELQLAATGSTAAQSAIAKAAAALVYMKDTSGGGAAQLQQLDQGLAQLVTSGHADDAKRQFDAIASALKNQGLDAKAVAGDFPGYEEAIRNAGDSAQTASGKLQTFMTTLQQQQAVDQINQDIQNLSDSIKSNGSALTGNSQAAIANRQAFNQAETDIINYANSQLSTGGDINTVSKTMQGQITQLENTATQAGIAKGDVQSYTQTLNGIPKSIQTTISANISPAQSALDSLYNKINSLQSAGSMLVSSLDITAAKEASKIGARASGGPVERNNTYWVGENGPELVTFGASGYVTPNSMLQPAALAGHSTGGSTSGGGATVVQQFIVNVAGSVLTEKRFVDVLRAEVLRYNGRNSANGLSLPT